LNKSNMKDYLKANGWSFSKLNYSYISNTDSDFKIHIGADDAFITQVRGFGAFMFDYNQWNETEEEGLYLELSKNRKISKRQFIKLVKTGELDV